MRTLYQFPLSHFCEKVRWMLDHKELHYVAQNMTPGLHRIRTYLHTKQNKLPILHDQNQWIADSSEIATYLDASYPEHTLMSRDHCLKEKILDVDQLSQELGRNVRTWLLHFVFKSQDIDILNEMWGEKGFFRQHEKLSRWVMQRTLPHVVDLTPANLTKIKAELDEAIAHFNHVLNSNGGRYLIGQRLTLADIAVCSMLAPLLMLEGTPWERNMNHHIAPEVIQLQQQLLDLPLGQYVKRIYQTERNPRIDWRGV